MSDAKEPEVTRAADYLDTHASHVRMGATYWDFTLIFGSTDDRGPGLIQVQDRAAISVSPQMLKFLALNINAAVDAYEAKFGKLHIPAHVREEIAVSMQSMLSAFRP